ncbi:MAG TPA: hypothetical protein VHA53_06640, partial [Nitrolancea sp.]|nr:hypothetical protein [Nitrolancea sp.]
MSGTCCTESSPFWADDFDMDLPRVIPGSRELLGELADVRLVTCGIPDRDRGNLNHPHVWNHDIGMIAFFGFKSAARPAMYIAGGHRSAEHLPCSVWQAFRDAWAHQYVMLVEQQPVWDTGRLWPE